MGNANYSRKKFEVTCPGTRKASLIRHEPWQLSICEIVILNSSYLWTFCSVRCRATVLELLLTRFFIYYIYILFPAKILQCARVFYLKLVFILNCIPNFHLYLKKNDNIPTTLGATGCLSEQKP